MKTLAGSNKVGEISAVHILVKSGGFAGGTADCSGYVRGMGQKFDVTIPVVDEVTGDRRCHNVRFGSVDGELCNFGRGQAIFDGALSDGCLISLKVGDSRDITTAIEVIAALLRAGAEIVIYCITCEAKPVKVGDSIMQPATNFMMRRASLQRIYQAQGESMFDVADTSSQFAFVRMDGKTPRLRVNFKTIPADCWFDAAPIPMHFDNDFGGQAYESVNADSVASANGIEVFDSGLVTIDGAALPKAMRTGEAQLLAAIINANGEAVKAPNRQTPKTMKEKMGHASKHIETVRGKGYRWVA